MCGYFSQCSIRLAFVWSTCLLLCLCKFETNCWIWCLACVHACVVSWNKCHFNGMVRFVSLVNSRVPWMQRMAHWPSVMSDIVLMSQFGWGRKLTVSGGKALRQKSFRGKLHRCRPHHIRVCLDHLVRNAVFVSQWTKTLLLSCFYVPTGTLISHIVAGLCF